MHVADCAAQGARAPVIPILFAGVFAVSAAEPLSPEATIDDVLDGYHRAAATADEATYFGLMTPDAVFVGTDASEHWTLTEFKAFAQPHFAKDSAWTYTSTWRRVTSLEEVAWFEEKLSNAKYGTVRGSGVLVRTDEGWRIAQYVMSFPIPNQVAGDVLKLVAGATPDP